MFRFMLEIYVIYIYFFLLKIMQQDYIYNLYDIYIYIDMILFYDFVSKYILYIYIQIISSKFANIKFCMGNYFRVLSRVPLNDIPNIY